MSNDRPTPQPPNPYRAAREDAEEDLERLALLVEELHTREAAWDRRVSPGLRQSANQDGVSWEDVIVDVMDDGNGRTVDEIASALTARGRKFGPRTRPGVVIRRVLRESAEEHGWISNEARPAIWRKVS